jgi:hypothetical protein
LEKLIISGSPTTEQLEEAKFKLTSEFSELSGGNDSKIFAETAKNYFHNRNLVLGLEISLRMIYEGKYDTSIEYLNNNGVSCTTPENEEQAKALIRKIELKLKNRSAKLKQYRAQYNALSSKKSDKPTRRYFNKLIVMLSVSEVIKMQIDRNKLMLSEFAEYLNTYNEYQQYLQTLKNKRK